MTKPSNAINIPGGGSVTYDQHEDGYVVTLRDGQTVFVPNGHLHAAYNVVCPVVDFGIEEDE